MTGSKHNRQREREKDQEDNERNGDAKSASAVGRRDRRDGRWRKRHGSAALAVTSKDRFGIEFKRASIGTQEPAGENVAWERVEAVLFDVSQHLDRDTGDLRELFERHLSQFALRLQVVTNRIHVSSETRKSARSVRSL